MKRMVAIVLALIVASARAAAASMLLSGFGAAGGATGPVVGPGPYSFVQSATNRAYSGTTVSLTLTGVVAGHTIMVTSCGASSLTTTGVTVGGSSATLGPAAATGNAPFNCYLAKLANAAAGSNAVVVTYGAACGDCEVLAAEYAGLTTTAAFDGGSAAYAYASSSPLACGSFTTANSGDFIYASYFNTSGSAPTLATGYTAGAANPSGVNYWDEFGQQTGSGAVNPSLTIGATAGANYIVCAGLH